MESWTTLPRAIKAVHLLWIFWSFHYAMHDSRKPSFITKEGCIDILTTKYSKRTKPVAHVGGISLRPTPSAISWPKSYLPDASCRCHFRISCPTRQKTRSVALREQIIDCPTSCKSIVDCYLRVRRFKYRSRSIPRCR